MIFVSFEDWKKARESVIGPFGAKMPMGQDVYELELYMALEQEAKRFTELLNKCGYDYHVLGDGETRLVKRTLP
jgi:hypothetical protein